MARITIELASYDTIGPETEGDVLFTWFAGLRIYFTAQWPKNFSNFSAHPCEENRESGSPFCARRSMMEGAGGVLTEESKRETKPRMGKMKCVLQKQEMT